MGPQKLLLDSNVISIGIHYFKVKVQIHYSRFPRPPWRSIWVILSLISLKLQQISPDHANLHQIYTYLYRKALECSNFHLEWWLNPVDFRIQGGFRARAKALAYYDLISFLNLNSAVHVYLRPAQAHVISIYTYVRALIRKTLRVLLIYSARLHTRARLVTFLW